MRIDRWFDNVRRTVKSVIHYKLLSSYIAAVSKVITEEIRTVEELLNDKEVEKLASEIVTVIENNKEAVINLKAHFSRFMARIEHISKNEDLRPFEQAVEEIEEIWK